jgi:hypothetical protein
MSGHRLYNPAAKLDNAKRPDNAESPDMSGLVAGHARPESLESSC